MSIHILRPGSVWGDEHLLLNAWWLLEPNTARALSFAEVMNLKRIDFEEVCERHPETRTKFRKYFVKYAVINGMIYAAKQEKQKRRHAFTKSSTSLISSSGILTGRGVSKDTDSDSVYDATEYAHRRFLARRGSEMVQLDSADLASPQHGYIPTPRHMSPMAGGWARVSDASDFHAVEERLSQKIENLEMKSASDTAHLASEVNKLRIAIEALVVQLGGQSQPHSPCSFTDTVS